MSAIEVGRWFAFPRGRLDYASTRGDEGMYLRDIALLFAFQELRRLGYETYAGNMTVNREHYQRRHQTGYRRRFGELWERLLELDREARAAGLRDFYPDYIARGQGEELVVKVTANGRAPAGDVDRYLAMAGARGLTPAVMAVTLRRRGARFLVLGYAIERF